MLAFGLVLPVTVERFAAAFGLAFPAGMPGVWLEGWMIFGRWLWAMAGSLKIEYRRKRNVGGRVLRNIGRCSTDTLADTFREKMLHASFRVWDCRAIGGFESVWM
jgi:hypothetical protein